MVLLRSLTIKLKPASFDGHYEVFSVLDSVAGVYSVSE